MSKKKPQKKIVFADKQVCGVLLSVKSGTPMLGHAKLLHEKDWQALSVACAEMANAIADSKSTKFGELQVGEFFKDASEKAFRKIGPGAADRLEPNTPPLYGITDDTKVIKLRVKFEIDE